MLHSDWSVVEFSVHRGNAVYQIFMSLTVDSDLSCFKPSCLMMIVRAERTSVFRLL